jgi:hypothetical protein
VCLCTPDLVEPTPAPPRHWPWALSAAPASLASVIPRWRSAEIRGCQYHVRPVGPTRQATGEPSRGPPSMLHGDDLRVKRTTSGSPPGRQSPFVHCNRNGAASPKPVSNTCRASQRIQWPLRNERSCLSADGSAPELNEALGRPGCRGRVRAIVLAPRAKSWSGGRERPSVTPPVLKGLPCGTIAHRVSAPSVDEPAASVVAGGCRASSWSDELRARVRSKSAFHCGLGPKSAHRQARRRRMKSVRLLRSRRFPWSPRCCPSLSSR